MLFVFLVIMQMKMQKRMFFHISQLLSLNGVSGLICVFEIFTIESNQLKLRTALAY